MADAAIPPLRRLLDDFVWRADQPQMLDHRGRNAGLFVRAVGMMSSAPPNPGPSGCVAPCSANAESGRFNAPALTKSDPSASSSRSPLPAVIDAYTTAGTIDLGSRPASEAAIRTASSRRASSLGSVMKAGKCPSRYLPTARNIRGPWAAIHIGGAALRR